MRVSKKYEGRVCEWKKSKKHKVRNLRFSNKECYEECKVER